MPLLHNSFLAEICCVSLEVSASTGIAEIYERIVNMSHVSDSKASILVVKMYFLDEVYYLFIIAIVILLFCMLVLSLLQLENAEVWNFSILAEISGRAEWCSWKYKTNVMQFIWLWWLALLRKIWGVYYVWQMCWWSQAWKHNFWLLQGILHLICWARFAKSIMKIALSFNRCLNDAVSLDEMWGISVKEVVTVNPSDARMLIPSAPLSSDCLICKISVCLVLVLECAGSCSYNSVLQYGWGNYSCTICHLTVQHDKTWLLLFF